MTPRRIPTSIRSERGALLALGAVTAACLLVLGGLVAAGDQRRIAVVATVPGPDDAAPSTLRAVSLTFDREPSRDAVAERFSISPEVVGSARWRGRTLEWLPAAPLPPGAYTVTLGAGALGRGGERLQDPFVLAFTVREPGVALIAPTATGERLLVVREGAEFTLLEAFRIRHFAVSPDGSRVATVTEGDGGTTALRLVDSAGGQSATLVQDPERNLATVAWSPDGNALLVVRRDRLPTGDFGVPRIWLTRVSGEFVAPLGEDGAPSTAAAWSPDAQWLAYVSPATAEVIVLNLTTEEQTVLGQPRSSVLAWSPDSRLVAFESTDPGPGSPGVPRQPVRVRALDGELDLVLGEAGEIRAQPRFVAEDLLLTLRRVSGPDSPGTELLYESVPEGEVVRSVLLGAPGDVVLAWDLDPAGERVVYTVRTGDATEVRIRDLEAGDTAVLPVDGVRPQWLP